MARATFYFDLGSPFAYLAAERIAQVIAEPVDWQPILLGGLFKLTGRSSWARGDHARRKQGIAEVERRALSYGLPPVRWPDPWPGDYLIAMRAATFAQRTGHARQFARGAGPRHASVRLSGLAGLSDTDLYCRNLRICSVAARETV